MPSPPATAGVTTARQLQAPRELPATPAWSLGELEGRLCEFSTATGGAALSMAFRLIHEAQLRGEPCAWMSARPDPFFAPDAAACGVDLDALPVLRVEQPDAAARGAEQLLRSGAFGLVVLDLGTRAEVPMPLQSRLTKLAQKHHSAVLCLTGKDSRDPSLSSLVSLRCTARMERRGEGRFEVLLEALKDKRRGPGWTHREVFHGPPGLR